jgi:hypothetical protein
MALCQVQGLKLDCRYLFGSEERMSMARTIKTSSNQYPVGTLLRTDLNLVDMLVVAHEGNDMLLDMQKRGNPGARHTMDQLTRAGYAPYATCLFTTRRAA